MTSSPQNGVEAMPEGGPVERARTRSRENRGVNRLSKRRSPKAGAVAAGATPATRALAAAAVPHTVHAFDASDRTRAGRDRAPSFGEEAAQALGVEIHRVFKTLVADIDQTLWVAVVPVPAQLDLKALAAAANGKRATMADPAAAERATGYVVGGISPLGQRRQLPTVVDASALEHSTVFVSGGRRGLDVELAGADLIRLTEARAAPIGR
jgi:Cys-tRNA(Pro)/Cys-tRNA(Cys) deacylase